MKRLISVMLAGLLMGGVALGANGPLTDQKGQKRSTRERGAAVRDDDRRGVEVHVSFSTQDVRVMKEYYGPRFRNLPPGLQKKFKRNGQLPPGWQKKMEPFPVLLERDLAVLPQGYRRGVIDGHAVLYNPKTQVIVDVVVLF